MVLLVHMMTGMIGTIRMTFGKSRMKCLITEMVGDLDERL